MGVPVGFGFPGVIVGSVVPLGSGVMGGTKIISVGAPVPVVPEPVVSVAAEAEKVVLLWRDITIIRITNILASRLFGKQSLFRFLLKSIFTSLNIPIEFL